MILVDANAWIDHLREADSRLQRLLRDGRVVTCDVVVGELALGSGVPAEVEKALRLMPKVPSPSAAETLEFIRTHRRTFEASGVGWADAQIIAAASAAGALLYSSDGSAREVWRGLGYRLA